MCLKSQLSSLLPLMATLLAINTLVLAAAAVGSPIDSVRQCEPIRIDMCRGLGYNVTGMPNMVGHELQQDAELQLQTFTPLIQYGCSSQLRFFLCAVYTPMCTEKVPISIGPCRPLCETVRHRCQPVLQEFGFPWPAALNCSKFPAENNHQHMCMEGPEPEHHERLPKYPPQQPPMITGGGGGPYGGGRGSPGGSGAGAGHGGRRNKHKHHKQAPVQSVFDGQTPGHHRTGIVPAIVPLGSPPGLITGDMDASIGRKQHYNLCQGYKYVDQYYYINRTERCAHNCSADILFTADNKHFASIWTASWAALCLLSTLFTISTFLVDSQRFRYPERAIIFLAANYCLYSCAYIYRLFAGRQDVSCHVDSQHNVPVLIQEGLDNVNCTIIFVLLYFFGTAAMVWWLILTLTWFLGSVCRWSPDRIDSKYTIYHCLAWILPALKTIAILVMRSVDADELTGTCYVGNQSRATLLYFVILPSAIYLGLGFLFLLTGVLYKWCGAGDNDRNGVCHTCIIPTSGGRQRHGSHHSMASSHTNPHPLLLQTSAPNSCCHSNKSGASGQSMATGVGHHLNSDKLNVPMFRVAIFALTYMVPAGWVLGTNIYEYLSRDSWYLMPTGGRDDRPNVEVFTLKIFMSLVIGIKTGLWMWSSKSPFHTWRKVGKRLVQKKQPLPLYLQAVNGGMAGIGNGHTGGHKQALLIPNLAVNGHINATGGSGKRSRGSKGNGNNGNETAV